MEENAIYDFGTITYDSLKLIDTNESITRFKDENDKIYYFKNEGAWFIELLADKIANFFGIPVVEHKKASFNGFNGVISEDFHQEGYNYLSGEELIKEYFSNHPEIAKEYETINKNALSEYENQNSNNFEILWWALEERYKNYPNSEKLVQKLMEQLVSLYEFQIITGQVDMHSSNYQIEETGEDANLAPLFDNAMSFMNKPVMVLSLEKEDNCTLVKDSIRKYFTIITNEQREMFIDKVNALSLDVLNGMMSEIINNLNLTKEELKDVYFEKRNIISAFLQNKKNILYVNKDYKFNRLK